MDPDTRITVEEALQHPWISVCILNLAYVAGTKRGRGLGRKESPYPLSPAPPPFFPFPQSPTPFDACYADYFILTLILFKLR